MTRGNRLGRRVVVVGDHLNNFPLVFWIVGVADGHLIAQQYRYSATDSEENPGKQRKAWEVKFSPPHLLTHAYEI